MTEMTPAERAAEEARATAQFDAERHRALYGMTDAEKAERDALYLRTVAAEDAARRIEYERALEKDRAERAAAEDAAGQEQAAQDRAAQVRAAQAAEAELFAAQRAAERGATS